MAAWSGSDRRSRLPSDWARRRRRALHRDGNRCTWVTDGVRCTMPATDVDHRVRGDDHSLANLQSLCAPHHRAKTARENAEARAAAPTRRRPDEPHPGLI